MFYFTLLEIIIAVLVVFIGYVKWKLSYWKRIGMPSLNPTFPYGDATKLFKREYSLGEQFQDFYKQLRSKGLKHGGVYMGLAPHYMPVDPVIIKHVMQVDFSHFSNHGFYVNEEVDPLNGHLFFLEDAKWKNLRAKLTPTFTSGKIKMMFNTVINCTVPLKNKMDDLAISKVPIDIKDILSRFTTDVIGSVAFGLECNSLTDPDAEFHKYGKSVFEAPHRRKALLSLALPSFILRMLNVRATKSDVEEFFMDVVKKTVEYREKNNIQRNDFMHLLIQLKNRGKVTDDEKITDSDGKIAEKALTMNQLTAQAFSFFLGGFETSSTTMTFALYELATNPDIQTRLREEINSVLAKHDNKITYEGLMEMNYMQKVLEETLRKHPTVPMLNRVCNKDYVVPGTNTRIEKGVKVEISVLGLQHDPEYYPEPEKFNPERFSEENKSKRPQFTWIPFGEGPRICIGLRFGILQSKVGLAFLLKNYHIKLNKRTKVPLTMEKKSFNTSAEGGIWLDVEKIN